jgi:hypothetical protein
MFSGLIRQFSAAMIVVACFGAATGPDGFAAADPSQDQKFFDLLNQQDIPPVDNDNSLIGVAKKTCSRLDEGMSVGDLVELIRNNGFNENPLTRLQNQGRITRTIDRFINAAVQAYCPNNRGKIASISAYRGSRPRVELISLVGTLPVGEINPTKPLPVPALPPSLPQEVQPVPQQPQPQPRHVQPAPQQAPPPKQAEPPQESPPEAGPQPEPEAPAPAAPAPPPPEPPSAPPDAPSPPGHVRLAP